MRIIDDSNKNNEISKKKFKNSIVIESETNISKYNNLKDSKIEITNNQDKKIKKYDEDYKLNKCESYLVEQTCLTEFTKKSNISFIVTKNTTKLDLYKGLIFMFFSCLSKSAYTILSKFSLYINDEISAFQVLTLRNYFMMILCLLITPFLSVNLFSKNFIKPNCLYLIISRTILAIISMALLIYSLKFLHVSDVYAVFYIYPGFLLIFSVIFFKEKIKTFDVLCLFACLIGAILVVKPNFIFRHDEKRIFKNKSEENNFLYYLLVLIAAVIKAVEDLIVKDIGNAVHVLSYSYFFTILGIILFPIPMLLFNKIIINLSIFEYTIIFFNSISTILYMTFLAMALRIESAGRISMVNYLQLVFMFTSDIIMFNKNVDYLDFIGVSLIFGFNFTNGLIKANQRMLQLNKFKGQG